MDRKRKKSVMIDKAIRCIHVVVTDIEKRDGEDIVTNQLLVNEKTFTLSSDNGNPKKSNDSPQDEESKCKPK